MMFRRPIPHINTRELTSYGKCLVNSSSQSEFRLRDEVLLEYARFDHCINHLQVQQFWLKCDHSLPGFIEGRLVLRAN
jgi:hypothetical protein